MRFRITVRGKSTELRGYADGDDPEVLLNLSDAMKPFGVVIASPAAPDYNPFGISEPDNPPTQERSAELIEAWMDEFGDDRAGLLEHLASIHFNQALVIRGERGRAERAEAELRARELHHFETEQILDKVKGIIDAEIGWENPALLKDTIRNAMSAT